MQRNTVEVYFQKNKTHTHSLSESFRNSKRKENIFFTEKKINRTQIIPPSTQNLHSNLSEADFEGIIKIKITLLISFSHFFFSFFLTLKTNLFVVEDRPRLKKLVSLFTILFMCNKLKKILTTHTYTHSLCLFVLLRRFLAIDQLSILISDYFFSNPWRQCELCTCLTFYIIFVFMVTIFMLLFLFLLNRLTHFIFLSAPTNSKLSIGCFFYCTVQFIHFRFKCSLFK